MTAISDPSSWPTRTTSDGRFSILDVIAEVTGKSRESASQLHRRLVKEKQVPPADMCPLKSSTVRYGPGKASYRVVRSRPMAVATVAEMSEILSQLPSATCAADGILQFKRRISHTQQDDSLCIMRYAFRSDCVKIGRSRDPERRRRDLEGGHAFRVEIVEIFPGDGYLEQAVRKRLADRRNTEGAGTEWFNVDVATAIKTVKEVIPGTRDDTGTRPRGRPRGRPQGRPRGRPRGRPPKTRGRGTEQQAGAG